MYTEDTLLSVSWVRLPDQKPSNLFDIATACPSIWHTCSSAHTHQCCSIFIPESINPFDITLALLVHAVGPQAPVPDDSCTLVGGTNWNQIMSKTQKVVNDLLKWGQTCGLKFNPEIIFTKASLSEYPNRLIVNGKRVDFSTSTKYLYWAQYYF